MKKFLLVFVVAAFSCVAIPRASAAISVSLFYDSLEPYGEWVEVADYGYVWHPAEVNDEWQPYTVGHWVFTDAGWTWMSEEPFGWATYHYGRWVRVSALGWAWVPDTEWGPAWVSWRRSPKHVGWAPLPPEARFRRGVPLTAWVDAYYDIGPTYYNFVEVRQFGSPRLREVVLPHRENITIINETRNITNITYTNNIVHNGGPEYDVIVRESAQPIRRLRLERVTEIDQNQRDRRDSWNERVEGDALRVIAPPVNAVAEAAPKKVARRLERTEIDRGWKGIADQSQAQKLRSHMKSEAKLPPALPPQPKFEPIASRKDDTKETEAAPPTSTAAETAPPAGTPAGKADKNGAAEKPMRTADRPGGKGDAKGRAKTAAEVGVNAEAPSPDQPAPSAAPGGKTARKGQKDSARPGASVPTATPDAATVNTPETPSAETKKPDATGKKMRTDAKGRKNVAEPALELPDKAEDRPDVPAKKARPERSDNSQPGTPDEAAVKPPPAAETGNSPNAQRRIKPNVDPADVPESVPARPEKIRPREGAQDDANRPRGDERREGAEGRSNAKRSPAQEQSDAPKDGASAPGPKGPKAAKRDNNAGAPRGDGERKNKKTDKEQE